MGKESPCQGRECWVDCVKPCQEWKDWFTAEWQGIQTAGREMHEGRADHLGTDCRSHE